MTTMTNNVAGALYGARTAPAAPALSEDRVRELLAGMERHAGVPADWWGDDDEVVLVVTHDPELARRAAEDLARRDLCEPYAAQLAGASTVEGPSEVVLTGTGDLADVMVRPAAPGDGYALLVCRVSPDRSGADPYAAAAKVANWLDEHNGAGADELAVRIMKVGEEFGEAVAAWIGLTGKNPRKGETHAGEDVAAELADVVLSALVAITSLGYDPAAVMSGRARFVTNRIDGLAG